ncbi:hypothetical protein Q7P37_001748 [Cladosporium fusiforme]
MRLSLFFLATVAAASQVDVVIDDVTALDQDVKDLTAGVRAYNGGLLAQSPLLLGLTKVHIATRTGYYDSKSLPRPLTETDATRLIDHVNATLAIDNPIAVEVLIGKKNLFEAAGTTVFIKGGLEILLDDHLKFSNEVLDRAPEGLEGDGQEVVDVITRALENGIKEFS